ncbi:MAG: hypothetical protein GY854_19350 [Deltaproteobacteria bacterium]|nr:hypothetical protein [Deltaproteobacteria bacterium]
MKNIVAKRGQWLVLLAAVSLVTPGKARAADGFGAYFTPSIGYSWFKLKSLEIDESFIKPPDEALDEENLEDLDFSDAKRSVGSKSSFKGGGATIGGSAGVRIFSVCLGAHYSWTPVRVEGYAKNYHYFPELARAGGRKFLDRGVIDIQRILFELKYKLPIWKFEIGLRTRVGTIVIDDNGLAMGRTVDSDMGFTGDLGASLAFFPVSFFSIGIDGWFGFYSFNGIYEGVFGSAGGLGLLLSLEI